MLGEAELSAQSQAVKPCPLWGLLPPGRDPFGLIEDVDAGADVFYAPNSHNSQAGTWVVTRYEQIEEVDRDAASFSSENQTGIPIGVFLGLMGLPASDFDQINAWAKALTHSPDFMVEREAIRSITGYLGEQIREAERQSDDSIISPETCCRRRACA